jgi:hypothetical protein
MRYRLRTLLILLAVAPPLLAGLWIAATTELGFLVLGMAAAMALYGIFTIAAVYALAWVIAAVNELIARLQDY